MTDLHFEKYKNKQYLEEYKNVLELTQELQEARSSLYDVYLKHKDVYDEYLYIKSKISDAQAYLESRKDYLYDVSAEVREKEDERREYERLNR